MAVQLRFNKNGKFKIMLMGDPHESCSVGKVNVQKTKDFLVFMNMALDEIEPDLVVFMGDNVKADNMGCLNDKIAEITKPIRSRNIPLAVVIGNHDLEAEVNDIYSHFSVYKKYERSVIPDFKYLSPRGDYNAVIKSSVGNKDAFNLWLMYSGNHAPSGYNSYYDFVRDEQIKWYEQTEAQLKKSNNGKTVPAMLFQHIPVPEEYRLLKEVSPLRMCVDAVKGLNGYKSKYFVLDKSTGVKGYMGEAPCPPDYNNGQFESWRKTGDIKAAFFGHDHMNDFIGKVDGITLAQCKLSGFHPYGDGLGQAVRVVELDEKHPEDFRTYMCRYRDIVGNFCQSIHGETRIMQDRVSTRFEAAVKTAAVLSTAGALALSAFKIHKKVGKK